MHEKRVLGGVVPQPDHLGLGEVPADIVLRGGKLEIARQVGVADDRAGGVAVEAAGGACGGDCVGDDQVVGKVDGRVARLGDQGVYARPAAITGVGISRRLGGLAERVADDGVVGDPGVALVDVEAAPEHGGGIAVHQVVRDGDRAVEHDAAAAVGGAVADDDVAGHDGPGVSIHADSASLADLPQRDVVDDGVGLDAGMRDHDTDPVALGVDASADGDRVGASAQRRRIDHVPADGVADDDRVAVADVDASPDPVRLRPGHDVAGDDVVADHGVTENEHPAARDAPAAGLAGAAGNRAALDGEVGAHPTAGAPRQHDRSVTRAGGVDGGQGGAGADDVDVRDDIDALGIVAGGHLDGGATDRARGDSGVGVVDGGLDRRVGRRLAAAAAGAGAAAVDVEGDGARCYDQAAHHNQCQEGRNARDGSEPAGTCHNSPED